MAPKEIKLHFSKREDHSDSIFLNVNADAPTPFSLPEPYSTTFKEKKEIKAEMEEGFGKSLLDACFNTTDRKNVLLIYN